MSSSKSIYKLLSNLKPTSQLFKRLEHDKKLTRELRSFLPSPLAENCHVGALDGQTLTIFTSSAVWASKLRYLIPSLSKTLITHRNFSQVTDINIKITNTSKPDTNHIKPSQHMDMSHESAELIRQTAESISDHKLRESLLRLSSHGRKKPS